MQNKNDLLSKAGKDLMLKEPYYGIFLIMLNKFWSDRLDTAGVSKMGINYQLEINEEFWLKLTDDHRLGILKHELLHIAFGHLTMYFNFSDRRRANVAMDMEINQYIEKGWLPGDEYTHDQYQALVKSITDKITQGLEDKSMTPEQALEEYKKIPPRGILFEDYADKGWDAKAGCRYYYDKLKEAQDEKEKNGTTGNEALDQLLDNMGQGNTPDHSTWEDFEGISEAEQKLLDKQLQKLLSDAKEQTLKKQGTVPGEVDALIVIEDVEPPKFDWRGYIRRFTGVSTRVFTKKIRRKENRKFPENPGLKIKMRQHMLLAIDTSGSVSNDELMEFMNEIHHIYRAGVDITIIQCDTRINSIEKYSGEFELNVIGRGGTYFDPVLEFFNDNLGTFTSLVYFTDGEATASITPKGKTLWVLSERSHMNHDLPGRVIKLEL
jgi:predicted metal-dependent peptidase